MRPRGSRLLAEDVEGVDFVSPGSTAASEHVRELDGYRTDDTDHFRSLVEEHVLPVRVQVDDVVHSPADEAPESLLEGIERSPRLPVSPRRSVGAVDAGRRPGAAARTRAGRDE
ncbi:hypothetical protein ABZ635_01955 [Nocardiopsis sp. NPDC007018]|uniref:hypothetical protein n=1 Tax=Nocardiopsis sp. NPDC007018 TaxID=3155721 RepID=UPI0033E1806E